MTPLEAYELIQAKRRFIASGCVEFTGTLNNHGYGYLTRKGQTYLAHRLAWIALVGPIPAGMNVLHRCDNPPCVNAQHLFLGTQGDNVRDMYAKGRANNRPLTGEAHPRSRLTEGAVKAIRERVAGGESQTVIARELGVSLPTVNGVVHGRVWRHVA